MTARQFPDKWYIQPYSWRQGYIAGGWTHKKQHPIPPENPCAVGTVWRAEWQAGFDYRRELMRGET